MKRIVSLQTECGAFGHAVVRFCGKMLFREVFLHDADVASRIQSSVRMMVGSSSILHALSRTKVTASVSWRVTAAKQTNTFAVTNVLSFTWGRNTRE